MARHNLFAFLRIHLESLRSNLVASNIAMKKRLCKELICVHCSLSAGKKKKKQKKLNRKVILGTYLFDIFLNE